MHNSVAEWLRWQQSLSPDAIDLSLDRTRDVAARLPIVPPANAVFTIAGTNGKGSTAGYLESLMICAGRSTGVYSSPHLVKYNERIRLNGVDISDDFLVESFAAVEHARQDVPLTYFEFGTLAALTTFSKAKSDVWILEIGLGGRFDAVNVIDPDYSLITTVALDHQEWLGETVEEIAAEKAGILRSTAPAFYGDTPVPQSILERARRLPADLARYGHEFCYHAGRKEWSWRGSRTVLEGLVFPGVSDDAQFRNLSLALAAVESNDASMLKPSLVNEALQRPSPNGRFQIVERDHQWILDVAHNQQAARILRDRIALLERSEDTTVVISMLADKQIGDFVAELSGIIDRWIICEVEDPRASKNADLAAKIEKASAGTVVQATDPVDAFKLARRLTIVGGRIVVCGSFRIVGPALEWLGLY